MVVHLRHSFQAALVALAFRHCDVVRLLSILKLRRVPRLMKPIPQAEDLSVAKRALNKEHDQPPSRERSVGSGLVSGNFALAADGADSAGLLASGPGSS